MKITGHPLTSEHARVVRKFEAKCEPYREDFCQLWLGARHKDGYGRMVVARVDIRAHRLSHWIHRGPIPDDVAVLHHCDNRLCVNPDHLYLGSQTENMRDASSRKRLRPPLGERHVRSKLTADLVRLIRSSPLSGAELARQHDLAKSTVNRARRGSSWEHVQ